MSLKIALERIAKAKNNGVTKLDLSKLELNIIPNELSNFIQLKNLNLRNNNISEIKGLKDLKNLEFLNLSENKITQFEELENLTNLVRLNLDSNRIIEINGLNNLLKLKKLSFNNNQITEITGLEELIQLKNLEINFNQINEIKVLNKLNQLNKLDLIGNQIKEIKNLENLNQLIELNLGGNKISEIKGLEKLTKLLHLYLWGNNLKKIKGIEKLKQLVQITLGQNKLTDIKGLENLKQLKRIALNDNLLTELPEEILSLGIPIFLVSGFEEDGIYLNANPFTNPPPEILKQGNNAIHEYFVQRKKSGEELLNEAKLILLGDGRSGKTSLANRLLKKNLPTECDRTQGVDIVIGEYSFDLANGKDFKINIWDFAGQDKYKTLHQLFYTDSSLYVMVAESGKISTDYDDWFQTAALFGEGSPLILILNEFKDGITNSFDSNYWKKQFPELLKEVITVNLGTMENFTTAEEFICLLARTLPHTKYSFPSNWIAVRKILNERRNEQYITLKEYLDICKKNNLPEKESALVLSSVLHKVGDCLHYQKSELLKQFIILKNEWATEAVYKILDDKIVAEKKCGFFDLSDLERLWNSAEYEDMRPQLLELMKQFKLAYQLPGKNEFVTPPLLPPGRPVNFSWPNLDSLELYIEYEFLPKALLTQFVVTRHADIAEGRTLVWRNGVILKWENEAIAEIYKTKLQGRDAFHIRSQGRNRKGLMTVILKTFRELHSDYKGIKFEEKVPCICDGCKTLNNKQYYFNFNHLQFRLEKGRYEVECANSLETLNVLELLENSFIFEQIKNGELLQLKENIKRDTASKIRILRLFLASSNELATERKKIEQSINRKNKILRKQGLLIELMLWEDQKHIGKSLRSQNNYNIEIQECDFFSMIFYSKVGKYSLEEFKLASSLFNTKGAPRISIFQKDKNLPKNLNKLDADSRYNFLEMLRQNEHFPILFKNTDNLVNELEKIIDKLLLDDAFTAGLKIE